MRDHSKIPSVHSRKVNQDGLQFGLSSLKYIVYAAGVIVDAVAKFWRQQYRQVRSLYIRQ